MNGLLSGLTGGAQSVSEPAWKEILINIGFAVLLLLVAFAVAWLAEALVKKALKALPIKERLKKKEVDTDSYEDGVKLIGRVVFLVIFLLFLPSVLDRLNMKSVSSNITDMIRVFLGYIPSIIASILIFWIGLFVAKLVSQILKPVFRKIKVDKLQEKLGVHAEDQNKLSNVLANIVYVVILVPVIIAALGALRIPAISQPATEVLNAILLVIPKILVAALVLFIGVMIARFASIVLTGLLSGLGADNVSKLILPKDSRLVRTLSLSKIVGTIVQVVIIVLFLVEAIRALSFPILTLVGTAIIRYLPILLAAVLLLIGGLILGEWAEYFVRKSFPGDNTIKIGLAKGSIFLVMVLMILNQLGVATLIVNAAFIGIIAAVAVAFALAFGLGGRKFAEHTLDKVEKTAEEESKKTL